MNGQKIIYEIEQTVKELSPSAGLRFLSQQFAGNIVFSTSFGLEDQAISHLIFSDQLPIDVFTLDTGRMFTETYSTWRQTLERYQQPIKVYYSDTDSLQSFVSAKGPNSFYDSIENRRQCCYIRKVEPLQRALSGKEIWITGLRAEQSPNRQNMSGLEWDETNQIVKFHPILHWTWDELKTFIQQHNVPYNILHDHGYISIGCSPCTRAIRPGEDFRSGRWWWEDDSKKECGLHAHGPSSSS